MIDWIKTGLAAMVAAIFATMVAWWNLGLPRLVFSPELAPSRAKIEVLKESTATPAPAARPGLGACPSIRA